MYSEEISSAQEERKAEFSPKSVGVCPSTGIRVPV